MSEVITVSNGEQLFRIESSECEAAREQGLYRPVERGLTVVGNDEYMFEIPVSDVEAAATVSGYKDLLEREHLRPKSAPRIRKLAASEASSPDSLLLDGLTRAEIEAEEARIRNEEELNEATGWRWFVVYCRQWCSARRDFLLRHLRGSGVSIAIHVAIFLLLASLVLVKKSDEKEVMLTASTISSETIEEIIVEPEPLEITEPTETESEDSPPEAEPEVPMTSAVPVPNFMAAVSGDAIKPPGMPSKDPGDGKAKPMKKSAVFGTKKTAVNYVFVIDNSNSMTKGRFETALNELMIAVNALTAKQRFYVIFYSDTAYPMMHPRAVTQLVPATPRNKQQLLGWLGYVELCLKTNGKKAIQAAFDMNPDVIYVLGDGAFTDGAANYFAKKPRTKTILHTRGMEVSAKNAKEFAALAKAHGGNYKDVGVSPAGFQMWRKNPRPRNGSRGQVWGIALPVKKK